MGVLFLYTWRILPGGPITTFRCSALRSPAREQFRILAYLFHSNRGIVDGHGHTYGPCLTLGFALPTPRPFFRLMILVSGRILHSLMVPGVFSFLFLLSHGIRLTFRRSGSLLFHSAVLTLGRAHRQAFDPWLGFCFPSLFFALLTNEGRFELDAGVLVAFACMVLGLLSVFFPCSLLSPNLILIPCHSMSLHVMSLVLFSYGFGCSVIVFRVEKVVLLGVWMRC